MFIYVNVLKKLKKLQDSFEQNRKETSENDFIAEYMLNKRSIHVVYELFKKNYEMPSESVLLCCPNISVGVL